MKVPYSEDSSWGLKKNLKECGLKEPKIFVWVSNHLIQLKRQNRTQILCDLRSMLSALTAWGRSQVGGMKWGIVLLKTALCLDFGLTKIKSSGLALHIAAKKAFFVPVEGSRPEGKRGYGETKEQKEKTFRHMVKKRNVHESGLSFTYWVCTSIVESFSP
jgi:hypothetical protein